MLWIIPSAILLCLMPCHPSAVTAAVPIVIGTSASIYESFWCSTPVSSEAKVPHYYSWLGCSRNWLSNGLLLLLQTFGKYRLSEIHICLLLDRSSFSFQWLHHSSPQGNASVSLPRHPKFPKKRKLNFMQSWTSHFFLSKCELLIRTKGCLWHRGSSKIIITVELVYSFLESLAFQNLQMLICEYPL